jgi:HSP20 family molecular chaperone IbpA
MCTPPIVPLAQAGLLLEEGKVQAGPGRPVPTAPCVEAFSRFPFGKHRREVLHYDPYRAIGGRSGFADFMVRARRERDDLWHPVMEAFHTYDDLVLRFEVAGVRPEDIELRVDGRVLWVQGTRRRTEEAPPELTILPARGPRGPGRPRPPHRTHTVTPVATATAPVDVPVPSA